MNNKSVIKDDSRILHKIISELSILNKSYTKAGLVEGSKLGLKNRENNNRKDVEIPELIKIGYWNEFGVKNRKGNWRIPPRPFISSSFDENIENINKFMNKMYNQIIATNIGAIQALGLTGEYMVNKIKNKIIAIREPKNATKTVKIKGFDNPLIWTGQMKNTVSHKDFYK